MEKLRFFRTNIHHRHKYGEKEIKVNFQKEIQNKSRIYTFENINYNEYIKRIENKIRNNRKLEYDEIPFLKFIILTNDKKHMN